MLRLLADENFNGDIVRALLLRQPDLDIVRVQDIGLAGVGDPDILAWAATNDRIILTHDRATLPDCAFERLASGESMPGVFILNDRFRWGMPPERYC
jgi:predicted nuclease of predicted toxin-antitoxin system